MKTIEGPRGPRKEDRRYRLRCSNSDCYALFEVERKELNYITDSGDCGISFYQFYCPHCKEYLGFRADTLESYGVNDQSDAEAKC